ncbi:MAG: SH3 domain-containing protein [Patescibacteria group bacterium]|nr:SH3 domain-containing protein [Patescibacteria group bacterium]
MEIATQSQSKSWTRWLPWGIAGFEFLIILFLFFNSYGKNQSETVVSSGKTNSSSDNVSNNSSKSAQGVLNLNESSSSVEPNYDTRFKVGDKVRVSVNTNLRSKASSSAETLQTLSSEENLEIIEGPTSADGYWWWKVKIISTTPEKTGALVGLKGYISEGYWLEKSLTSATSSATP